METLFIILAIIGAFASGFFFCAILNLIILLYREQRKSKKHNGGRDYD